MFLKRQIPILIVIVVGFMVLFGHFINNESVQGFIDNDSMQWFDIIASFAMFLGALNMLKLQMLRILKRKPNWQYSILAVGGFAFAIFAGFFFRGANLVTLENIDPSQVNELAVLIVEETGQGNIIDIETEISTSLPKYQIEHTFILKGNAEKFNAKVSDFVESSFIESVAWGAHVQKKGSLFSWMFFKIYTPLSATMFALLAFFVASASYRAFRIRNFEATLLLISGIILMMGRVPMGDFIPWWFMASMIVFGISALLAPFVKEKQHVLIMVIGGLILFIGSGTLMGWNQNPPQYLLIPVIQDWIFDYPTTAGSRAIMIGVALGTIAASFRFITGIERSFLGE